MTWKPDYLERDGAGGAKAYLRVTSTADDAEIAGYITAASRAIDDHTHRQFGQLEAPAQRFYTAYPDYDRGVWVASIDDLAELVDLVVKVNGTVLDPADYRLEPSNAIADGEVYERIAILRTAPAQPCGADDELDLLAKWGWPGGSGENPTYPAGVVMACKLQVARLSSRRGAPFGTAGSPSTGGESSVLDAMDPEAAYHLRGLIRPERAG